MSTRTLTIQAEQVHDCRRERVLSGDLRPGERSPIGQAACALGISDIPAGEGVERLAAEGLLQVENQKGAVVAPLAYDDIEEVMAIRVELEVLAVRRVARTINRDQLDYLQQLLEAMEQAERGGRLGEYGALSREFHFAIYEAQPYKRLLALIRDYWSSTDWCCRIFSGHADIVRASRAQHRGLYEALVAGDGDRAAAMLREQELRASDWLLEHARDRSQGPAQP